MRRRARRDPELARLDGLGAEGRRAELAALAASLDEPTPPRPAPTVAEQVRAELERQREADRQAAEDRELKRCRHPDGGGCWRCGAAFSFTADDPAWGVSADGCECVTCWNEQVLVADLRPRAGDTASDLKVRWLAHLLDVSSLPMRVLADPAVFASVPLWFSEFPDARPVAPELRWAHLGDRTELRRRWDALASSDGTPPPAEPEIMQGERCEECGCVERFAERSRWSSPCGVCEACVGNTPNLCNDRQSALMAGACIDCRVGWAAAASGSLPGWWVRRRGKRLPSWARPLVEQVSA